MSLSPDQVRKTLNARRDDWKRISEVAGISYSWIYQFANKKTNNPRYDTLEKLTAALKKTPAQV